MQHYRLSRLSTHQLRRSLSTFHRVNELEQLCAVDHLHKWFAHILVGHDVDSRGVIQADTVAQIAICLDQRRQLSLWIDYKRQIELVRCGEFFCERMQIVFVDLQLMLRSEEHTSEVQSRFDLVSR